jgi:hypothetical protein
MYVAWKRGKSRLNSHVEAVTGSTKSRSCSTERAGTTSEAFYRREWLLDAKAMAKSCFQDRVLVNMLRADCN